MSESMRRRIAIAIGRVAGGETFPDDQWEQYTEYADAVLAAMREPTEPMRKVCLDYMPGCDLTDLWQAVIDEAAAKEPK